MRCTKKVGQTPSTGYRNCCRPGTQSRNSRRRATWRATLSGGQRQRIAIARALRKDAPILLLDEPTSSVDPESERLILDALRRLVDGRTVLLVAHLPSTLELAHRVAVLASGKIVESGEADTLRAHVNQVRREASPAGQAWEAATVEEGW